MAFMSGCESWHRYAKLNCISFGSAGLWLSFHCSPCLGRTWHQVQATLCHSHSSCLATCATGPAAAFCWLLDNGRPATALEWGWPFPFVVGHGGHSPIPFPHSSHSSAGGRGHRRRRGWRTTNNSGSSRESAQSQYVHHPLPYPLLYALRCSGLDPK